VDWSQKILNSLSDYQYVGLSLDEVKDEKNNFFHPKIFIPGLDQVEVFTLFSLFALPAM
jgi:hypothetical protein